jgi:hypothetical protein
MKMAMRRNAVLMAAMLMIASVVSAESIAQCGVVCGAD